MVPKSASRRAAAGGAQCLDSQSNSVFAKRIFWGLPGDDVGEIAPGLADGARDGVLDRQRGARAGHDVERGMQDEARAADRAEPRLGLEGDAGVDQPGMGGEAAVQFLPARRRAEQLVAILDVVLGRERHQRDGLLEREESGVAVHPAEHLELVAQEVVDLAPGAGVQHRAREVGPADRDLLADAGAHADQADQVHVLQAEVIEQADRVGGMQRHRRGHAEVVGRIADAAIVEDDDLVAIGEPAREMPVVVVAERAPAAHAEHGLALA